MSNKITSLEGDSEQRFELPQNEDYGIVQLRESWDERFEFHAPKLSERYLRGKLAFHLHVRCRLQKADPEQFVAVFRHMLGNPLTVELLRRQQKIDLTGTLRTWHAGDGPNFNSVLEVCCGGSNDEQAVLVNIAKRSENNERVIGRIGTEVRLYAPEDFSRGPCHALYSSVITGRFVFIGGVANRETVVGSWGLSGPQDQRCNEVIETGTNVMDYLASKYGETKRDGIGKALDDIFSGVVLVISDSSIGLRISPEVVRDFGIEIVDGFYGPLNLSVAPL